MLDRGQHTPLSMKEKTATLIHKKPLDMMITHKSRISTNVRDFYYKIFEFITRISISLNFRVAYKV